MYSIKWYLKDTDYNPDVSENPLQQSARVPKPSIFLSPQIDLEGKGEKEVALVIIVTDVLVCIRVAFLACQTP